VEIISEATRSLPDAWKDEHLQVPRADIARMGNRLRHKYDGISDFVMWNIVVYDVAFLKETLDRMAAAHGINLQA
jgi:uncharacterized protein with HEPN domain